MLAREVPCSGELRLGRSSRASVVGNAIGRIVVTIFAATSGAVVLTTALATCALHGELHGLHDQSKAGMAKATVKKYAFEAYPSWRHDRPGFTCPGSLLVLNEYMNQKDTLDPWGRSYRHRCEANQLLVSSRGEDGRFGTVDDVKSWD